MKRHILSVLTITATLFVLSAVVFPAIGSNFMNGHRPNPAARDFLLYCIHVPLVALPEKITSSYMRDIPDTWSIDNPEEINALWDKWFARKRMTFRLFALLYDLLLAVTIVAGIDIIRKRRSTLNHTSDGIRRPVDGSPKPSM